MKSEDLLERTQRFSLRIINFAETLPSGRTENVIASQILRSATAVGANYRAARHSKSGRDFIYKLKIIEEETDETLYWLELLKRSGKSRSNEIETLIKESKELLAIFIASIKTAKRNEDLKR